MTAVDPGAPSAEARASLAWTTLDRWAAAGLRYCIWKSLDRFDEGARGQTDLDVLVHPDDRRLLHELARADGWIEVRAESWRRFPGVEDFVRLDERCDRFLHLHAHFRLVMGEPRTKSLALPLEELYLTTAVDSGGLRAAVPELELVVFVLRLVAKVSWKEYARIVYWRSRREFFRAFRAEFDKLRARCHRCDLERLLDHPALAFVDGGLVLGAFDDLDSLGWRARRRIRRQLAPYRRIGRLRRRAERVWRAWLDLRVGPGKTLAGAGRAFAFCGADGSGKTTLVDRLEQRLREHFRVTRVYLGGNLGSAGPLRGVLLRLAWWPYLGARWLARSVGRHGMVRALERGFFGLDGYLIAREKRRRHRHARRTLEAGGLVLYERFPLFPGPGDGVWVGPRSLFPRAQQRLLASIEPPDRLFLLGVDARVAAARKPDHDPGDIGEKVRLFERYASDHESDPRLTRLDAARSADELFSETLACIAREIAR